MTLKEFVSRHCIACGGNWTAMFLTGIKNCFPDFYKKMPKKNYSFEEVARILEDDLGVVFPEA